MRRHIAEYAIQRLHDTALVGAAEPDSRFHQRIEHDLQIEGRAADDLQDVCSGCLLLKGFVELLGARLDLPIEAPQLLGGLVDACSEVPQVRPD